MANPYRGEVDISLGGEVYIMRLTLGVLAELEAEMKSDSLMALVERFESGAFSARDLISLLSAGLKGGGADPLPGLDIDGGPVVAAQVAARLLRVTFAVPDA
jgi:hypothetical protein